MSKWYPCVYCTEDLHCTKFAEPGYEDSSWCVCGPCISEEPSHGDLIRRMDDEELANWIHAQIIDRNIGIPVDRWLNYLKAPAKGGS